MNKIYSIIIIEESTNELIYSRYQIGKLRLFGMKIIKQYIEQVVIQLINYTDYNQQFELITEEYGGLLFTFVKKEIGYGTAIISTSSYPHHALRYLLHRCSDIIQSDEQRFEKANQLNDLFDHFNNKESIDYLKKKEFKKN